MNDKLQRWLPALVLIAVIGLVHVLMLRDGHDWGGDFSQYIQEAKNLASGAPYEDSGYVYNKNCATVGPPTYPPGCPALLAPVYAVFGFDLTALKAAMIVSFLAALFFMYLNFVGELRWTLVCAVLVFVGLNPYFLLASNTIGSDLPFLAFLFLTLCLAERAYAHGEKGRPHLMLILATGLSIYASFAVRTVGGVLLPTLWVYELIRYRRISGRLLMATGLFASLTLLQVAVLHNDSPYLDQFDAEPVALLMNSLQNAWMYVRRWVAFWHNGYSQLAAGLLFLAAIVPAAVGYGYRVRQGLTVREVFPWLYLAVVFAFPAYQGERFLFPVLPLYVFYLFSGLERLLEKRPIVLRRLVTAGFMLAMTVSYAARYTTFERGSLREGVHTAEAQALFQFIAANSPRDDVVVFVKPRVMALYSGRPSATYHEPENDRELWGYFAEIGAGHVVTVDRDAALTSTYSEQADRLAYLRRFVRRHLDQFECVYFNRDFRVWRVKQAETVALN